MRCSAQVVKSLFMSDAVLCVQCRLMTSSGSCCPVLKQTQWLFILQTFPRSWSVPLLFFFELRCRPFSWKQTIYDCVVIACMGAFRMHLQHTAYGKQRIASCSLCLSISASVSMSCILIDDQGCSLNVVHCGLMCRAHYSRCCSS